MPILTGLFDHMVLQRSPRNVSDARITGTTDATGPITATVTKGKRVLPGFAAKSLGTAAKGKFAIQLTGLPTGGPYTVELRIADSKGKKAEVIKVGDVLVGDVWISAGQSNMEGIGLLAGAAKPHPMARAFYMNDRWGIAQDPVNCLAESIDPVHVDLAGGVRPMRNPHCGTGPAVGFIQEMHRATGVPQGIIASAHGGTSMAQWNPAKKAAGGKSLYGATLRRFQKNGAKVAGIIWYQGCSDAGTPEQTATYTANMKRLVAAFRRDFRSPTLPFALVQIARVIDPASGLDNAPRIARWNSIQDQQRLLPAHIKHTTTVPAIDLALDDLIHISGADQQRLGKRLAHAMLALRKHPRAPQPPVALKRFTTQANPRSGNADVFVEFEHVHGALQALSRPVGFTIQGPGSGNAIYNTQLDGHRVILHTILPPDSLNDKTLSYGQGLDPICNITDALDHPLPVFGPLPIAKPRACTPFASNLEVSAFQPSAGKLHQLSCPTDLAVLDFARRAVPDPRFCNIRPAIAARPGEDLVAYFRCPFVCPEPMKLAALLGYDGPVRVFLDGQPLYHDPKGTNPAVADAHAVRFSAAAGNHELLIALATNAGQAWGIFLRFERLDLAPKLLRQTPPAYTLPVLASPT